ncbi:MAG: glycoside hydrolase family 20 zincin-like fold domain-containing protein, partial [Longimicrobiales bacterium]|nr:glycoside hydrolase family 20 zincin-like fold domain-containing protein [Longimicrobiales bacterium]
MSANPVWPLPQELRLREDALSLAKAVLLVPPEAEPVDLAPIRLLADMLADDFGVVVPIVKGELPRGALPIEIAIAGRAGAEQIPPELPGAEGYLLNVTAQGARALGRDPRGAQHAVATLIQLAERRGSEVVVRGAEVRDWPHKPIRMVHLYVPGSDHLGYARRYLRDFLVRYKFNGVFIEVGGGVRLRGHPEIAV